MTNKIEQRITQVQNGELPEGYKKTKVGIVPNEWEIKYLKQRFQRLTRKNTEGNKNVLTISAQYGLINQNDFFNKEVASEDKSNYYLLRNGEFAYNKSYSNGYPFGAIKKLTRYDSGVVSPLYICFNSIEENKCPEFYEHYFEGGYLNKEIQAFAQEGARNHGLLNISVDDFFNSYICVPSLPEQQKIAEILTAQDKVIELKEKLIAEKEAQKKYLMQNLLTGKKRLKGFSGEWKKVRLGEVLKVQSGYAFKSEDFLKSGVPIIRISNIAEKSISLENCAYYSEFEINENYVAYYGDILIAMSGATTGKIGQYTSENIAYINQRVGKFIIKSEEFSNFILKQLLSSDLFKLKLDELLTTGAQPNLSSNDIENCSFKLPDNINEQNAIAEILSTADREIELLKAELAEQKQKKKALMQLLLTGIVRVES